MTTGVPRHGRSSMVREYLLWIRRDGHWQSGHRAETSVHRNSIRIPAGSILSRSTIRRPASGKRDSISIADSIP
jgi:hypothetical protein